MSEARTRLPLLSRMRRDLDEHGSVRRGTAALMWTAYASHAVTTCAALRNRTGEAPLSPIPARVAGVLAAGSGLSLCVLGMRRFSGASELTGTINEDLVTEGVYRYSRNPQYLGYVLTLTGLALIRRSGTALGLTGLLAYAYARWVRIEEGHLSRTLGQPYLNYQATTRRWWGRR